MQARTDYFEKGKSSSGNVIQYLSQIEIVSNNLKYFECMYVCAYSMARCLLYSKHKCATDPSKVRRPSMHNAVSSPTLMRLKCIIQSEYMSGGGTTEI